MHVLIQVFNGPRVTNDGFWNPDSREVVKIYQHEDYINKNSIMKNDLSVLKVSARHFFIILGI